MGMQRPVLSLLALTDTTVGRKVLLQKRNKKRDDTPYSGYLELPQGRISESESVASFAAFKLQNETGLEITKYLVGGESHWPISQESSSLYVSTPFCCVADVVQNHFAIGIVVLVAGKVRNTADAEDHRWYGVQGITEALAIGSVFPLNVPILRRLVDCAAEFGLYAGL